MRPVRLFDSTNLRLLSCWECPRTIQDAEDITAIPEATIYKRVKILLENQLIEQVNTQRTGTRPRPIYFSRIQNVSVKLDLNRYFVIVRFKDGTVREEGYSA